LLVSPTGGVIAFDALDCVFGYLVLCNPLGSGFPVMKKVFMYKKKKKKVYCTRTQKKKKKKKKKKTKDVIALQNDAFNTKIES